jgi:hypothetical protein
VTMPISRLLLSTCIKNTMLDIANVLAFCAVRIAELPSRNSERIIFVQAIS